MGSHCPPPSAAPFENYFEKLIVGTKQNVLEYTTRGSHAPPPVRPPLIFLFPVLLLPWLKLTLEQYHVHCLLFALSNLDRIDKWGEKCLFCNMWTENIMNRMVKYHLDCSFYRGVYRILLYEGGGG